MAIRQYLIENYPILNREYGEVVLMPIKPEFSNKIFNGEKKVEYRKVQFKKNIRYVIVYSSFPVKKIVGFFVVDSVVIDKKEKLWEMTQHISGISQNFFREYYANAENATAILIKNTVLFDTPIEPLSIDKNFKAPQSFCYL